MTYGMKSTSRGRAKRTRYTYVCIRYGPYGRASNERLRALAGAPSAWLQHVTEKAGKGPQRPQCGRQYPMGRSVGTLHGPRTEPGAALVGTALRSVPCRAEHGAPAGRGHLRYNDVRRTGTAECRCSVRKPATDENQACSSTVYSTCATVQASIQQSRRQTEQHGTRRATPRIATVQGRCVLLLVLVLTMYAHTQTLSDPLSHAWEHARHY